MNNKHICILYSGGMDSFLMKKLADKEFPDAKVTCVYFNIGQEYAEKEIATLPDFVEVRNVDWLNVNNTTTSKSKIGSSSGTIYIPGRNMVFAVMAASMFLPDEIWLGSLKGEDHSGATDKNDIFREKTSDVCSYVLKPFIPHGIKLVFPFVEREMSKLHVTQWALNNGISINRLMETSSCMSKEHQKCGECVVCQRRWGIFSQLGYYEKTNKHVFQSLEFWKLVYNMLTTDYYNVYRKEEILPAIEAVWMEDTHCNISIEEWVEAKIKLIEGTY